MTERDKALMRVQTCGFAVTEAVLFLDTHPTDSAAREYYDKAVKDYNAAVMNYITSFGPLDMTQVQSSGGWSWTEGCMPWEEDCNVEI